MKTFDEAARETAETYAKLVELARWCKKNEGDIHTVRELVDWEGLDELLADPLVVKAMEEK